MRQGFLPFDVTLAPGEVRPIEIAPTDPGVAWKPDRLVFAGVRRQYEMVRPWRGKGWLNKLMTLGPPVEVLQIEINGRGVLAGWPTPATMFDPDHSPELYATPTRQVVTMLVRCTSRKPYRLRGGFVGWFS